MDSSWEIAHCPDTLNLRLEAAPLSESQTTTFPKRSKPQLKCFQCRLVIQTKDGAWGAGPNNQQVFLCKKCATANAAQGKPRK